MQELESWLNAKLPGNCQLDAICGQGGMGVVFRVLHHDWGIPLAVKVPRLAPDMDAGKDFLKEAELWADLGLQQYVATLYYTRVFDGRPCTFGEYLDGGGLDRILRTKAHRGGDDETTLSRILSLAVSTAWGLDAAHSSGLVHCDFKPGNVLVESDFTAKVTDFGLARRMQDDGIRCPGRTPLYASPEQARSENLTTATDYWSWAATCFEMFCGEPVWQSGQAVRASFDEYIESGGKCPGFPRMPQNLSSLLRQCLEPQSDLRPTSFASIAEEIAEMHSELLSGPCPATTPDNELNAADSLNNRAVSLLDVSEVKRATEMLHAALVIDNHHPEAIFNLYVCLGGKSSESLAVAESMLLEAAKVDAFNHVPYSLLARLYHFSKRSADACERRFENRIKLPV